MIKLADYIFIDTLFSTTMFEDDDTLSVYNESVFNLWYNMGFTKGEDLKDIDRTIMANAFEKMFFYLTGSHANNYSDICKPIIESRRTPDNIVELLFPSIRRLYTKYHIILKPEMLEKELKFIFIPIKAQIMECDKENKYNIDAEAEALSRAIDIIGNIYKKLKRRKRKHKNERHKD